MRSDTIYEQKKFWFKLKLALGIVSSWWLLALFAKFFYFPYRNFGLSPQNTEQLYGIITYPFIHGDFEHLSNNSLSGFIIFSALFLIYEKLSVKVLLFIYLASGILLWFIGEPGSMHIGASSIIYGVAFFLFFSGMIIRDSAHLALSLFMVVWYGSMVWGITPFTVENGISWEGHLSGAIVGSVIAFWFNKNDIIKEKVIYPDEDDEEDFNFFEKYPIKELIE
ncbi:MAG: membrane associated rhomboid family serine protease [Planctomycetota bacterium]|jgi:membrane associated rhomboid family serine protease